MDSTTRGPDAPVVAADDDPWAGLAAPDAPAVPLPADVVKPTMPWDVAVDDVAVGEDSVVEEDSVVGEDTAEDEPVEDVAVEDAPVEHMPDVDDLVLDEPVDDAPAVDLLGVDETIVHEPVELTAAEDTIVVNTTPDAPDVTYSATGAPVFARAPEPVPTAVAASASRVSFPPGVANKLAVYVYLLVDARTGRPFHVGRGRGDRCFRHVEEARATGPEPTTGGAEPGSSAGFPVLDRIREAESDGRPVRIEVLRYGLTGDEADLVVAAVDDALALGSPTKLGSERVPAVELGASLAKRAKIKRSHQVVLLRVGPHGADTAYATARHGWRIGRRWVDLESVRSPKWAVLVAGDLADSVYRIDGWQLSRASGAAAGGVERWSFTGERDPVLEDRYVGRSVSVYLGVGASSQVTYVWCGPHWVNTAQ
jgi:uncharacterized protein